MSFCIFFEDPKRNPRDEQGQVRFYEISKDMGVEENVSYNIDYTKKCSSS